MSLAYGEPTKTGLETLHISLLGEFKLQLNETAVALDTPTYQALLAYLVLHPGQVYTRQHLAFTFWPDSSEKQARTNLRKALYVLRHTLPDAARFLQIDPQRVAWRVDSPYALDVAEFETAVTQAEHTNQPYDCLVKALDLYRGDLLPAHYQDWIIARREKLQQQYLACLAQLVQLAENSRNYEAASSFARRLLREDPLQEAAYRSLMRLQALAGDRAGALRTYHTCTTCLQRELGISPSPVTQEAYRHLLNLKTVPVRPLPVRVSLVAREKSWSTLHGWWQRATRQRPLLGLLRGEAGIGKTRLAEELIDWAARQGITTLSAACYAASDSLPYAPVTDWLRAEVMHKPLTRLADKWQREVGRVLPELLAARPDLTPPDNITERWQQQHLFTALATAILLADQPLLLFIDNFQWCDPDTLAWLCFLLHYESRARFLLLGAVRTGELTKGHPLTALCQDLQQDGRFVELDLGRLDAPATATLATQVTGQAPDIAQAARLFTETEGVPLFIVEMARAGEPKSVFSEQYSASSGRFASGGAAEVGVVLPSRVREVIEARLANLSLGARELVGLAAAIGRFFTFDLLAAASQETETRLVPALDELWQQRIIREQGAEAYDFSHDKLRKVAYASLSAAKRRWLHGRIAAALELLHTGDLDSVSGKLAAHCKAAGRNEEAIGYYRRAANVAQALYANQDTLRHLQKAIDLLPKAAVDAQQQVVLYEQFGDVLGTLGRYEEAEAAFGTAAALAERVLAQARIHRKMANTYQLRRRHDEAFAAWQTAEKRLGPLADNRPPAFWQEWLWIQLDKSWLLYWTDRTDELEILLDEISPIVEEHGTTAQKGVHFHRLVILALRRDRYLLSDETIRYARMSYATTKQSGTLNQIGFAQFALGLTLFYQGWDGNPAEGESHMLSALELAEEIGDVMLQLRCLVHLSQNYLRQGDSDAARAYLSRATGLAQKANVLEYVVVTEGLNAWQAWRNNDFAKTQQSGEIALAMAKELPFGWPAKWTALFPLMSIATMQDEIEKAVGYARHLLDPGQMRLRDEVTAVLQQAIHVWESNLTDTAHNYLQEALRLAQKYRYL